MIERRWKLMGCAAALLVGLLAARPAMALGTVCSVDWDDDGTLSSADLNGDGMVDGVDLGLLLTQWGACPRCASDFNGDGQVGCLDKEYLLGNWGPCPQKELDCTDVGLLSNSLGSCTDGPKDWPEEPEDLHELPEICLKEGYTFECPSFDVNNDGIVDGDDLNLVTCLLEPSSESLPLVDFDGSGTVDQADLDKVEGALGEICNDIDQNGKIGWPDVYILIGRWY